MATKSQTNDKHSRPLGRVIRCVVPWLVLGAAALFVFYGTIYALANAPSRDRLPFDSTFEDGSLGEWKNWGATQLCCAHSAQIVTEPVRAGRYAIAFIVNRDDPNVRKSKRAELRLSGTTMGEHYWYGFSVFVPGDWTPSPAPVTAVQWHAVPDVLIGELGQSPALRLLVRDDQWMIANRWDPARVSRSLWGFSRQGAAAILWSAPLDRGRWTDWIFHVRWSFDASGIVEIWKDGTLVAKRAGANTFNDWIAPYFKIGVYVPSWGVPNHGDPVSRRSLLFDEIRVRRSSARPLDFAP